MISKKNIIILICVLVLLVGALIVVNSLWKVEKDSEEFQPVESIEVFTTEKDNISEMALNVAGEEFSFALKDEQWVLKGDESVKLNQSKVDYLRMDLAGIYAKEIISEKEDDLAQYGLKEPAHTYTLTFTDGSTKTFYLGNKNAVSQVYYFKTQDSPKIYTIYATKGDSLTTPSAEYKDSYILNVDIDNLRGIKMQSGNKAMELKCDVTSDGQVQWNMISPISRECDSQPVSENIISKVSYITVSEFIAETDERYANAGVSSPAATLTLTDANNISQTIYVGKADGENRYIKTNDRVYLIPADSVSFIDIDPFIYVSKFISLQNIEEISKAEVTHNGVTHTLEISGKKDAYTYKLNGKEVMEDTFKRQVYQKAIGLLADGFSSNSAKSQAVYTVTYYKRDGSVIKTEYHPYDDRSYAAFNSDGTCHFIIRQKKLEEMFTSIDNVASGKTAN